MEYASVPVFLHQRARLVYGNRALRAMVGVERLDDLVGRPLLSFIPAEDRASIVGYVRSLKVRERDPAGDRTAFRLIHAEGKIGWVTGISREVPHNFEEVMLLSEASAESTTHYIAHLATFVEQAPDPILEVSPEGHVFYTNAEARALFPGAWKSQHHPLLDGISQHIEPGTHHLPLHHWGDRIFERRVCRNPGETSFRMYARDVTEREHALHALQISETRFAWLFRDAPVGMALVRLRDMTFLEVNSEFSSLLGYAFPEDLHHVSAHSLEATLGPTREDQRKLLFRVIREGVVEKVKVRVKRPDGTSRRLLFSAERTLVDDEVAALVMAVDIEQEEVLQETLRQERNFAHSVLNSIGEGLIMVDVQDRITYANPAMEALLNTTLEHAHLKTVDQFIHPDARAAYRARKGAQVTRMRHSYTTTLLHADGSGVPVLVTAVPLEDEGQLTGAIGVMTDLRPLREAEAKLKSLKDFYEEILDKLPIEVSAVDPEGRFTYLNPKTVKDPKRRSWLYGRTVAEYGVAFGDNHERFAERHKWVLETLRSHFLQTRIETYTRKNGSEIIVRHTLSPVHDEHGNVAFGVGFAQDITDEIRYTQELARARDRAEELSRMKSALLANISHEVRTPLTAIIGFADILQDELLDEEHRELAYLMKESGERLLATLNSVLDLARLEAGTLRLNLVPIDVHHETAAILRTFRAASHKPEIEFHQDIGTDTLLALGDAPAFQRVLSNLLSNAYKFTEKGRITVRFRHHGDWLHIDVEDTGEGISPAFLPHVFDEFRQESDGLDRRHNGSGLGLSITKRLVHLMNGTISVASQKGHGTTFTVSMRLVHPDSLTV